jgi:hypothetical protein
MHLGRLGLSQAGGEGLAGLLDEVLCVIFCHSGIFAYSWPSVIVTWRMTASRDAQATAGSDSGDRSTPTIILYSVVVTDISHSVSGGC